MNSRKYLPYCIISQKSVLFQTAMTQFGITGFFSSERRLSLELRVNIGQDEHLYWVGDK